MNLRKTRKSQVWQNLKWNIIWFCKTEGFFPHFILFYLYYPSRNPIYGIRLTAILRVWVEWDKFFQNGLHDSCLARVSTLDIKHGSEVIWIEKYLFQLTVSYHSSIVREVRPGNQTRQESRHGNVGVSSWLALCCLAQPAFLQHPGLTSSGAAPCKVK